MIAIIIFVVAIVAACFGYEVNVLVYLACAPLVLFENRLIEIFDEKTKNFSSKPIDKTKKM